MKKLLSILCATALVASSATFAGHIDTEIHNSANQSALVLRGPQKSKGHPIQPVEQSRKGQEAIDPPSHPIQTFQTSEDSAWDARCVEAIC